MSPASEREKLIGGSSGICSNLIVLHVTATWSGQNSTPITFPTIRGRVPHLRRQNRLAYASRVIKVILVYHAEMTTDRNATAIRVA